MNTDSLFSAKTAEVAQLQALLNQIPAAGIALSLVRAEAQAYLMPSNREVVAITVRLVADNGILMRRVSSVFPEETMAQALARIALGVGSCGVACVDILQGQVDQTEAFHTDESLMRAMASLQPRIAVARAK